MTELERRAILGDRQAQEEITKQGIVLPCPFCGSRMKLLEGSSYFGSWMTMCNWCGAKTSETGNKVLAIAASNRRTAPPVGRCEDCKNFGRNNENDTYCASVYGLPDPQETDYCSYFKPIPSPEH